VTDQALDDTEAGELLDAFLDLSGWSTIASGQAQLAIAQEGGSRSMSVAPRIGNEHARGFRRRRRAHGRPASGRWR